MYFGNHICIIICISNVHCLMNNTYTYSQNSEMSRKNEVKIMLIILVLKKT